MPFEVPAGWAFGYGKDLFAPMQSIKPSSDTFYYADIESVDNTTNTLSAKTIKKEFAPSRASRYCEKGDLLFSMVRPYLKNIAMVNISNCIASTGFYICHSNGSLDKDYLFRMMLSDYVVNGLNTYMKGDNSPSINKINIDTFLFPVPPLAEQKRIMAEINRWFALIDTIEQGKADLETAIKDVFGDAAYKLNISSTKSMTGHLLGAAGAVEAMACVMSVKEDIVPPTINHVDGDEDPDIDYDLNFTFNKAQKREVRAALSNTFGFGGHNACIVFKKYAE